MDIKTIEKIQARMEMDTNYQADLKSYKKMVGMEYELPPEWEAKSWVRKQISTDAHDAVKLATNIYDTNRPTWEILPRGLADVDRAERLEVALEWWMQRANKLGTGEPFRKSLHNSLLQNRVIYNLDYLPYWLPKDKKKWNKEQKAAMKASSFCLTCHDAGEIWYEVSKYGLKWVAHVSIVTAEDALNHWAIYESDSVEGKKVKSAIVKLKKGVEDELSYISVEYTSHDKREVSLFPTTNENLDAFENADGDSERIDVMDTENKLSFINWSIVEGESTPLLYSMHKGGLWSNQCLYDTLITSTTARRAVMPIIKHISQNGKELQIEYRGEHDVIDLTTGEQVEFLIPPPIDQAMSQLSAMNTNKMAQASGIKGLASIEIAGNVQYAAIDAVIKLHMTSLVPYVRSVEKANSQVGNLAFQWLQQGDGFTENAYRTENKGEGKINGEEILISSSDFDTDTLYIECTLKANTPTDKMQEVNMATSLQQAGAHISWKRTLENLNLGNGEVLEAEWIDEQAVSVALQNKIKQLDAEIQMKVAEHQAQIQMMQQEVQQQAQMQQQQQGQEPATQRNPVMPRGQGANAAMGGEPTGTSVPGSTSPVGAK